jgi:Tol biopolymer transport system component
MRTSEIRRFFIDGSPEHVVVAPPESGKDLQEARLAPDGRYLYYTERRGGDHYVFVNTGLGNFVIRRRDLQTGDTVDLIGGFGSATTPQVSPDGKQVAFIRRLGAKTVLFRYDVEAGTQHPVNQDLDRDLQGDYIPQEHYYPSFDWLPDNRHVAIWGKGQLYKIDTQTGSASAIPFQARARHRIHAALRTKLDAAPSKVDVRIFRQLAISPSGELVFHALGRLWRQDRAGQRAPQRLTTSRQTEHEPAWAPDGKQLAFVEWHDETGSALKVRAANGGKERVIARSRGVIRQPIFSRDGKRVAYRIMEPDGAMGGAAERVGIYLVNADGTNAKFLTAAPPIAPSGSMMR